MKYNKKQFCYNDSVVEEKINKQCVNKIPYEALTVLYVKVLRTLCCNSLSQYLLWANNSTMFPLITKVETIRLRINVSNIFLVILIISF